MLLSFAPFVDASTSITLCGRAGSCLSERLAVAAMLSADLKQALPSGAFRPEVCMVRYQWRVLSIYTG